MATGEAPITRTDLREELANAPQHYATKADLATDLAALEVRLTNKIAALDQRFAKSTNGLILWVALGLLLSQGVVLGAAITISQALN